MIMILGVKPGCQFRSIKEKLFFSFSSFRGFHTSEVISLGGDRGRGPVYVRSTSDRVEILCTAVKDAKCQCTKSLCDSGEVWRVLSAILRGEIVGSEDGGPS